MAKSANTALPDLTLAQARDMLLSKDASAVELTRAHLERIAAGNEQLNAFIEVTLEKALAMAEASDARIAKGDARPLEGLPLGIKDLFCTRDVNSTACSNILKGSRQLTNPR